MKELRRLGLGEMVAAGARAVRARRRLVVALYFVEMAMSLCFTLGLAYAFGARFGERPLWGRAVAGDDGALIGILTGQGGIISAVLYLGAAWAVAYAIFSLYLTAGLLGAFTGRPFGDAAGARFWAFVRLWLLSLIPWAIGLVACGIGLNMVGDSPLPLLVSQKLMVGQPLLFMAPGLIVLALVSCAVDYARARLVVRPGGALRALLFGFKRIFTATALPHYLLYVLVWTAVSFLYVAGTYGVAFAGMGGALGLFVIRQIVCFVRFSARAATSAGQVRALEVELLEVRQVVESPEARSNVSDAEAAKPVE